MLRRLTKQLPVALASKKVIWLIKTKRRMTPSSPFFFPPATIKLDKAIPASCGSYSDRLAEQLLDHHAVPEIGEWINSN